MGNILIVISQTNPDPLYKQVTDQIRDAIAKGNLPANMRLPSIRNMADELNISAITIKRAYANLESEGYIITRSGMGSFVAEINRDQLKENGLSEIRTNLEKIVIKAAKFGISKDEIKAIIDNCEEARHE